ncbi:hypothetical protein Ciccas_009105 [Cichlidogyrus casuarinus]|uniref:Uncharacterized protein n=1 Tax=Cichlidogyrus casuarinus TaxID=1844966 RepID=A0ABD2PY16_9PLAT
MVQPTATAAPIKSPALQQQLVEKLNQSARPLVSNPPLYSQERILAPVGSSKRQTGVRSELDQFPYRGLKYKRQGLAVSIPKPLSGGEWAQDEYLSQHLETEQPLNWRPKRVKQDSGEQFISASPSPPTLEDNIRVLCSKLEPGTAPATIGEKRPPAELPMLWDSTKGRVTPPMQLFHVPDLKILNRAKLPVSQASNPSLLSANFPPATPCSLLVSFQLVPTDAHSHDLVISRIMQFFSLPPNSIASLERACPTKVLFHQPETPKGTLLLVICNSWHLLKKATSLISLDRCA